MGGSAYGFPESKTPYLDQALRNCPSPPAHPLEVPAARLQQYQNAKLEEHILTVARAIGVDRENLRNALIQAGLWLCPLRLRSD